MSQEHYRILIADDEDSMRDVLAIMLRREKYLVETARDGSEAMHLLSNQTFDLVVSDMKMPRMGGMELLNKVRERYPETMVIMITAFSSTEEAVEAMKQGAYDYITKPFRNEEIRLVIKNALERRQLRKENVALKKELACRYNVSGLVGKSKPMQQVFDLIEKVADNRVNVMITGESGTGKELVARAIHFSSDRRDQPFLPVNCGAIPENLLESELFGHERGSFTGAIQQKLGLFEVAGSGTLFLDEIGELPAMMQVKLLRALQEREIRRVGGTKNIQVEARIIAATNKALETEITVGRFREDLFYRLNVIRIELPPLRERREDIPMLVEHLFHKVTGRDKVTITDAAMQRLLDYAWPGNIRELENCIERCVVLGHCEQIDEKCLPAQIAYAESCDTCNQVRIPDQGFDLDDYLGTIEKSLLLQAIERNAGVRKRAAEMLGISFRSIRYRLAKFGLDIGEDEE